MTFTIQIRFTNYSFDKVRWILKSGRILIQAVYCRLMFTFVIEVLMIKNNLIFDYDHNLRYSCILLLQICIQTFGNYFNGKVWKRWRLNTCLIAWTISCSSAKIRDLLNMYFKLTYLTLRFKILIYYRLNILKLD